MKVTGIHILSMFILLITYSISNGQSTVFNSSFQSFQKRAENFYEKHYYKQAIDLYIKASQTDADNNEIKLKIADCYIKLQEPSEAIVWYNKIPETDTLFKNQQILQFAHALAQNGDTQNAEKWYKKYSDKNKTDKRVQNILRHIDKPETTKQDTTEYDVEEVAISTNKPEFAATYYGNEGIVFIGTFKKASAIKYSSLANEDTYFDMYLSTFSEDPQDDKKKILNPPVFFDKKLNSSLHEGPLTFAKQETKIIFTRNLNTSWPREKSSDGVVRLGLFEAERDDRTQSKWKNIREFPFNSKEFSVCHPTTNRDGTVLYFASDMPGGEGGFDIYKSTFVDGYWSAPKNLGPKVNTEGQEVYPFLHNDETLYFASNGHGGFGGLDVFKIDLTQSGQLMERYHLMAPINSTADDYALVLDPIGTAGYITSNRKGGMNDDLFKFFKTEAYKTKEINYVVRGTISSLSTTFGSQEESAPLDSVEVKLIEVLTTDTLAVVYTDTKGKFELSKAKGNIKYPGSYKVIFQKPKYGFSFFSFEVPEDGSVDVNVPITMRPIEEEVNAFTRTDSLANEPVDETETTSFDNIVFPTFGDEPQSAVKEGAIPPVENNKIENPKRSVFNLYGQVLEGNSNNKIPDARIYASSSEGGNYQMITVDDKGNFNLDLARDKSYILKAVHEGYSSDCFLVEPIQPDAKYKQTEPFRIFPIELKDTLITIKSLAYTPNWRLSQSSYENLQDVVNFLTSNASYIIEVGAHTTRDGNYAYNKSISLLQSLSVIEYLLSQGINRNRLIARGYGESNPIYPCPNGNCSKQEKQGNERIEISVINYLENFVSEMRKVQEVKNGVKLTRINCSEYQEMYTDNNESIFEGKIVDSNSQLALDSALIYIYNTSTGTVKRIFSDSSGEFVTRLTTKQEYIIKAFKENHKPDCHIVKMNEGVIRKVYDVTWSLDYMKDMSLDEQKLSGFWDGKNGNYNYTTCIEN